ncbi:MAG: hypothetical protein AAGF11_38915 [Myxococcota bacterium]
MTETEPLDPLALFERPAALGERGAKARRRAFADQVWVRPAPSHPTPAVAALLRDWSRDESRDQSRDQSRDEKVTALAAWPEPDALRVGDRVILQVTATAGHRHRYVAWLRALAEAAPASLSVAPCSADDGGMHRLWCIATARVLLPDHVHVEARHDLLGIRLAQLAVGFGADTLAGPVEPDRTLPLAGVTRPDEATAAGLATLVRQVGLTPRTTRPHGPSNPS